MSAQAAKSSVLKEIQAACFTVGEGLYGVDIMTIREIIRHQKATPVPRAPEFVEGIINLRGVALPVVDMRIKMGLKAASLTKDARIMIVKAGGGDIGMLVDAVTKVIPVDAEAMKSAPMLAKCAGSEYLTGVAWDEGRTVMILDAAKILAAVEKIAIEDLTDESKESGRNG